MKTKYSIKDIITAAIYWGNQCPTKDGVIPENELNKAVNYYVNLIETNSEI